MKTLLATWLLLSACTEPMVEDGPDDSFVGSGKADTGGVAEGTPEAIGVLALANVASLSVLDVDVGLSANAANNIIAYRLGDDETAGTADDERFDTLAELDAVPFVGPVAWQSLLAYAEANGYVMHPQPPDAPPLPEGVGSGQHAATCSESSSYWNQTCFPWKPCDYPVTGGRTENGTSTAQVECSLAGDTLACTVKSTACSPRNWWFTDKTITGDVAASGAFVLEHEEKTGDAANGSWYRARLPGRVIRTGTTTVILDQVRIENGYYSSGRNDSTTYRNSTRKTVLSPTISIVLNP